MGKMEEKDRMRNLTQSFEEKGEIFKENRDQTNSEKLKEEFRRLAELSSGEKTGAVRENIQSGGFMGGSHGVNQGRTVNSIVDDLYSNPTINQGARGNLVAIKDDEALEISIKRTLNSGAPVNNIAFYDEVNWNLAQLGFPSKLPQDIKSAIIKLIN
jgi:hypothetical protein